MPGIAFVSYSLAALMFLILGVLLLLGYRGGKSGAWLIAAVAVSALWGAVMAYDAAGRTVSTGLLYLTEVSRLALWIIFLVCVIQQAEASSVSRVARAARLAVLVVFGYTVLESVAPLLPQSAFEYHPILLLLLAVGAIVLIEQIYRNTDPALRWSFKYMWLGLGGILAYECFVFSYAILIHDFNPALWEARGVINAIAVPFIAIAATRSPQWAVSIFVSRHVAFYSASLVVAGGFLVTMAIGAYYIRLYGGSWGSFAQIVLLFSAGLAVLMLLLSGQARAKLKVLLAKHFYAGKYDYREEWLRLVDALSTAETGDQLRDRLIRSMAGLVDSTGGTLWELDRSGGYQRRASWNMPEADDLEPAGSPMVELLRENWVIDLDEGMRSSSDARLSALPEWLAHTPAAWLVVPLRHRDELQGFIVLARSRASRPINWEDRDLLKAAGTHAASYLALLAALEHLEEANRFEAFNRLSAYVVHDIKNLVAQLALVVTNAARHKHNPEFMDDAIDTIQNAVGKMNRLLVQLSKGRFEASPPTRILLARILAEAIETRSIAKPVPVFSDNADTLSIVADAARLRRAMECLIQNAQEATDPGGYVRIALNRQDDAALITIEDDGCGMDASFIREQLFRPFSTTKGNAGMGIGAYESRELVRSLGGDIVVDSRPGAGSTFTIRIPLGDSAMSPAAATIS